MHQAEYTPREQKYGCCYHYGMRDQSDREWKRDLEDDDPRVSATPQRRIGDGDEPKNQVIDLKE